MPDAATLNVAVVPAHVVTEPGDAVTTTGESTVTVAGLLVDEPQRFSAMQTYSPASCGCAEAMLSVELVAPGMITPLRFHLKVGAGVPEAVTESCTGDPGQTDVEPGEATIVAALLSESTACDDVVEPQWLVVMQSYAPASFEATAAI